ncbi:MAG: CotH kinase family protein, partial [Ruminococcus sp.]|nr:CotH kinase family protein [Ruminococcus sp.]
TLRNGGNDCEYAKMRDPLLQSVAEEMDFELQQAAPCVVFLDGEYWGMYSLTEDYSDNYIQNNYPIEKENVVMLKCGELEAGEEADYELYTQLYELATGSDMTDDENYKAVGELLDLDSFIDYCAFNMYIGNSDCIFDDNNWRMWRVRTPDESCEEADGKWRMMVYDTDFSTGIYGETADKNPIDAALNNKKANGDNEDPPADIFTALMKNPEFSQKMMLTLMDMRNFTFEKDRVSARIDEFDAVYSKLVPDTFKRFGPQYSIGGYGRNVKGLREYLSRRYDSFIYSMNDSFHPGKNADVTFSGDESKGKVYVNGHRAFLDKEVSAKYFLDYPITVGVQPKEGQKFVKWECSGCTASDPTSQETQVTIGENGSIKAIFE